MEPILEEMSKSNNSAEMNLHYKRRNGDQDCHVGHTCTGSSCPWGTRKEGGFLEESSLALWSFLEPASSGYQVQKLPCTDVHSLKVKVVNFKYKQLKFRSCMLFLQLVQ
jgi:hypothetical protein